MKDKTQLSQSRRRIDRLQSLLHKSKLRAAPAFSLCISEPSYVLFIFGVVTINVIIHLCFCMDLPSLVEPFVSHSIQRTNSTLTPENTFYRHGLWRFWIWKWRLLSANDLMRRLADLERAFGGRRGEIHILRSLFGTKTACFV